MLPLDRQNLYRAKYKRMRPGWRPSGEELEALARRQIGPAAQVLDLGCGRGGVLELLAAGVRRAVGLDPDWASLVEHRAAAVQRAAGVGAALPFPARQFDVVLGVWVLEHLPDPDRVLGEIARVLRPGGHFIFITPNLRHPLLWAGALSRLWPAAQRRLVAAVYARAEADTFGVYYRANTLPRLRALAAAHRFQPVTLRAIADPTYLAFNAVCFGASVWLERCLPAAWGVHWVGDWVTPE